MVWSGVMQLSSVGSLPLAKNALHSPTSSINTIVQFNECERRSCINITIVDYEVPENTEYFDLNLERNGLHERIQLDPTDGLVQITNNDGTCTVVIARPQY